MLSTLQMILIVCPLVFFASFVDAIAGGGGLIALPAYLLTGMPGAYGLWFQQIFRLFGHVFFGGALFEKRPSASEGGSLFRGLCPLRFSLRRAAGFDPYRPCAAYLYAYFAAHHRCHRLIQQKQSQR